MARRQSNTPAGSSDIDPDEAASSAVSRAPVAAADPLTGSAGIGGGDAASEPGPDAVAERARVYPHLSGSIRLDHWVPMLVVLATILLGAAVLYLADRLLTLVHHTALLFALGGLVAYALDPVVEWVRGTYRGTTGPRRPRWLGVVTVFASIFAAVAIGVVALGEQTAIQIQYLSANRDTLRVAERARIDQTDAWLAARNVPFRLSDAIDHPPPSVKAWGERVAHDSFDVAKEASRSAFEIVVVLLIAIYFLIYSEELSQRMVRDAPDRMRDYLVCWRGDVNRILGGFVRGQLLLALVMGAAATAACALLGLKLWLLIGFFVVVVSLLPVIGPYIGAVPALVSAVLTPSAGILNPVSRAITVVVLFVIINEAGSKILYPRLVGKALGLHEVVVLLALLCGFEIGGIPGVLFAAPATALAAATVAQLWRLWHGEAPLSLGAAVEGRLAEGAGGKKVPPPAEQAAEPARLTTE